MTNADRSQATRRSLLAAGSALALSPLLTSRRALAQAKYPSRPIEFIVPWGAGGGADQLARRVGKLLEADLGVSLPVLNVPGATGVTGTTKLLTAEPDGHSIAVFIGDTLSTLAGGKGRFKLADFAPLGVMIRQPTGLFVKADARWKTFADLLADAKASDIKTAILGFGSADEIHVAQMNAKGYKFRMVPFAKPGERYSSILGGHADVLLEQAGDVRSFLDNKQMRPLAFFADQPQTGYESIPLAKASGFPIAISQFRSIVMRAGTDARLVARIAAAMDKVAASADYKKYLVDELAFADSYIPAAKTGAFFERELKAMVEHAPKKP